MKDKLDDSMGTAEKINDFLNEHCEDLGRELIAVKESDEVQKKTGYGGEIRGYLYIVFMLCFKKVYTFV